MPVKTRLKLQDKILAWYGENQRDLPWRKDYSAYRVWISEMMLQQTQIATMLPYYFRWMARFPDAASIADAAEDEVLRHWEGLGYYARARNIHKTARLIAKEFGGVLPRDFPSLRKLPGIGLYSAGAIMSFAYNADFPAADANAGRILSRLFDISVPSDSKQFRDAVWYYATEILPKGRSRDFNQALMDFGSLVCNPRGPSCVRCPVVACCAALKKGVASARPVKGEKKTPMQVHKAIGICIRNGRVLVRKRPQSGLMPGLWELPGVDIKNGERSEEALGRAWLEELGIRIGGARELTVIRHSHTAFRVTLHVFLFETWTFSGPELPRGALPLLWAAPRELGTLPFASAHRRAIKEMERLAFADKWGLHL